MVNYPKMIDEVIEGIESTFCDFPSVKVDCMLYLLNALAREKDVGIIRKWFEDSNKCPNCGADLTLYTNKEYHPEVDCWEERSGYFCFSCLCDGMENI